MIDWNKAPKETTHHGEFENHECWYQVDGGEVLSWYTDAWGGTCWKRGQLTANNEGNVTFTPRPEVNPVYTQEMHEAGELPSVGMEVIFKHSSWLGARHEQAEVLAITKEYLILQVKGQVCENHFYIKDISFKPPVKLVDGKAYQFNARDCQYYGIYNEDRKILNVDQGQWFDVVAVTNIQPLTVEK